MARGSAGVQGGGWVYSGFGKLVALQECAAMILLALGAPLQVGGDVACLARAQQSEPAALRAAPVYPNSLP